MKDESPGDNGIGVIQADDNKKKIHNDMLINSLSKAALLWSARNVSFEKNLSNTKGNSR